MFERVKQCAGTVHCRFRFVLRVSILLTIAGILSVFVFVNYY